MCGSAKDVGMKINIKFKKNVSKPWLDTDCTKLQKDVKNLLNKYKNCNFNAAELVEGYIKK